MSGRRQSQLLKRKKENEPRKNGTDRIYLSVPRSCGGTDNGLLCMEGSIMGLWEQMVRTLVWGSVGREALAEVTKEYWDAQVVSVRSHNSNPAV